MQEFINFLGNNYIWFLIVAIVLIFALIGYLIDTKNSKEEEKPETIKVDSIQSVVMEPTKESFKVETPVENNTKNDEIETLGETIEMPKINTVSDKKENDEQSL